MEWAVYGFSIPSFLTLWNHILNTPQAQLEQMRERKQREPERKRDRGQQDHTKDAAEAT